MKSRFYEWHVKNLCGYSIYIEKELEKNGKLDLPAVLTVFLLDLCHLVIQDGCIIRLYDRKCHHCLREVAAGGGSRRQKEGNRWREECLYFAL